MQQWIWGRRLWTSRGVSGVLWRHHHHRRRLGRQHSKHPRWSRGLPTPRGWRSLQRGRLRGQRVRIRCHLERRGRRWVRGHHRSGITSSHSLLFWRPLLLLHAWQDLHREVRQGQRVGLALIAQHAQDAQKAHIWPQLASVQRADKKFANVPQEGRSCHRRLKAKYWYYKEAAARPASTATSKVQEAGVKLHEANEAGHSCPERRATKAKCATTGRPSNNLGDWRADLGHHQRCDGDQEWDLWRGPTSIWSSVDLGRHHCSRHAGHGQRGHPGLYAVCPPAPTQLSSPRRVMMILGVPTNLYSNYQRINTDISSQKSSSSHAPFPNYCFPASFVSFCLLMFTLQEAGGIGLDENKIVYATCVLLFWNFVTTIDLANDPLLCLHAPPTALFTILYLSTRRPHKNNTTYTRCANAICTNCMLRKSLA